MKSITLTMAALHIVVLQALAQSPFGNANYLSGYQKEIAGETITYTSIFPDFIDQALLTRASTGKKAIEWETAKIPKNQSGKYVYFKWVAAHASGSSSGDRNYDVYVDDNHVLTFITYPGNKQQHWMVKAKDSTALAFEKLKTDGAGDAHGTAYLRIPISKSILGRAVRLKVVGQHQDSNDWYMTFKYGFEQKVGITVLPFLTKKSDRQPLMVDVFYFGKIKEGRPLKVMLNNHETFYFPIKGSTTSFEVPISPASKGVAENLSVSVKYGKNILADTVVVVKPIKERTIHFIHHSHTDVGYSYTQPEVARIHNQNIRDAIVAIEKTSDYPEEAKFKWNVESLWAVENFLAEATPTETEKFIAAVKSGSIYLSALYANILTGQSMPEEMFHYTDYAKILEKKYGLTLDGAMVTDIPGFSWATVAALAKGGVRYLSSGPNHMGKSNPYLGDRAGHFVTTWGDKPVWWTSPSGEEKILFWTAGRGYASWHGAGPGDIFKTGKKKIAEYMDDLRDSNYPYEMVQWRYSCLKDNGPIDHTISDYVKQWNEQYKSPRIVLNTTDKMCDAFEKQYGDQLPVVSGDITPYWEDGSASTAYEEGMARYNSLRLQQLTTLYAMISPKSYDPKLFYEAWKNILLFNEHTWGAHNSISAPDLPFVTEQWRIKRGYVLNASKIIDSLNAKLLHPLTEKTSQKIAVLNTLSWARSAPVYVDASITANIAIGSNGKPYELQKLQDGRSVFVAENVAPLSVAYFTLEYKKTKTPKATPIVLTDSTMSNGNVSVSWDKHLGSITALVQGGKNFVSRFEKQGLNAYWYVPGRNPEEAISNDPVEVLVEAQGPHLATVKISGGATGTNQLIRRISLWAHDDKVFLENTVDKKAIRTKEGLYFAFPFQKDLKSASWDAGYGTIQFLKNQLPGSNLDFESTKRWLDVSDTDSGIQLLMKETFLMSPESPVDERLYFNESYKKWREKAAPTSLWFSYVMNNYWHTNYKADQSGVSSYNYALRPHGKLRNVEQEKAAMAFSQPLITIPIAKNATIEMPHFEISNNNVVVTSISPKPSGGYTIRLFNPEETPQEVSINWNGNEAHLKIAAFGVYDWQTN